MILFMWQDDIIGVVGLLTRAYKECTYQLALPWGTRHLISPKLAGKHVLIIIIIIVRYIESCRGRRAHRNFVVKPLPQLLHLRPGHLHLGCRLMHCCNKLLLRAASWRATYISQSAHA